MIRRTIGILMLTVVLLFSTATTGVTAETGPSDILRQKSQKVLDIIGDTAYRTPEQINRVRDQLIREVKPLFGFREMTLRSLGHFARQLNSEQINQLTDLFQQLLEKVYVERLTKHLTETNKPLKIKSFKITGEERKGRYARVHSKLSFLKGDKSTSVQVNYKMVNRHGEWKIYDLEVEDLSIISNYRDQFTEILTNYSVDYLMKKIHKMIAKKDQALQSNPNGSTEERRQDSSSSKVTK
ncbi:MAG: phospholipid-binding protein MlaC [bacterium]